MCTDTFVPPIPQQQATPWEKLQILLLGFQLSLVHLRSLDGPDNIIACISSNTIKFARLIKFFAFFCSRIANKVQTPEHITAMKWPYLHIMDAYYNVMSNPNHHVPFADQAFQTRFAESLRIVKTFDMTVAIFRQAASPSDVSLPLAKVYLYDITRFETQMLANAAPFKTGLTKMMLECYAQCLNHAKNPQPRYAGMTTEAFERNMAGVRTMLVKFLQQGAAVAELEASVV
jgi:hypothetical protein